MAELQPRRTSYAKSLEAEQACEFKHEYLRGEVYARAGGTPEHARLASAILLELGAALRGRLCNVYG